MKNDRAKSKDAAELRSRAEEQLENTRPSKPVARSTEDVLRLLHELEVHQIELEMQNEELHRSRAEVEAGFERYIDLYDFAPVGYLSTDCEGAISQINFVAAKLLDLPRSELLGRRLGLFVPAGSRPALNTFLQRACAGNTRETCEMTLTGKGNNPRQVRIEAVGSQDGKECRIVLIDITERRRAEEALNEAKETAEKANEAKDRFLATLSHELRTPLTPILAAAQMLERRSDLPPGVWSYVDVIRRNVGLEARLIDDLLDLNRIVYGKIFLAVSDVNVHEVIKQAAETCKAAIQGKQQVLSLRLDAKSHNVRGDWSRLQQVLWNLISNSSKFTPAKGEITISTESAADQKVVVKVVDNGKGIDAENLPRLFSAFEQGTSSVTREFGGLGLGLAISRGIAEMHGGTLKAYSEGLGRGSTFALTLPAETLTEAEAETEQNVEQPVRAARRILLVEDHEDTGALMKAVLDGGGHKVHFANSVASALQAAEQEKFDLLLCDVGLPDGSGLDVVSALRKRNAVEKAVAMTGFGMAEDVEKCKKAGFDTHLTKPVDIDELERLIAVL